MDECKIPPSNHITVPQAAPLQEGVLFLQAQRGGDHSHHLTPPTNLFTLQALIFNWTNIC